MENEKPLDMIYQDGWTTFKNLPNRVVTLLWKIVGWKGVLLALTVLLMWFEKIPEVAAAFVWIATMILVLFGEKGLQYIKELKR